ncbi:MAG TPA: M56 family metallopeptidase, partial [Emticicia sp.]
MLFLTYLLKVSVCLTVFYGLYFFAFRKFTFHTLNRFYLLCTLLLSFIIPLISFETTKVVKVEPAIVIENSSITSIPGYTPAYTPMDDSQAIALVELPDETPDWRFYVLFAYIAIAVIMMLFLCAKLLKIYQLSRYAIKADHLRIVQRDGQLTNASFFNLIFLNTNGLTDIEKAQIIAHECVHIKHLHSIDILLVELCKIILWFNPIIYFYKKSLVEVHEFEVDLHIIQQFDSKNYAHLLLKLGINHTVDLTNQFSLHPLSTRIHFLFKKRTVTVKKIFYTLCFPLLALGIFAFAQRHEKLIYETAVKASEEVNNKIANLSEALQSIDKDSLNKNKEKPLVSINQKDSVVNTFGSMINPFLFKTPEVALPYPNKITVSNNLHRIIISMGSTPFEFSFDHYKGAGYVVENTTEGNIKILQDGEELIKDKDYTFVYDEGYISKIKFKEHVWRKKLSISIIAKDLSFRALPKTEAIPLPSIYYRRGDTNQNSQWRYTNFEVSPQKIGITTDDLKTPMPANFLDKEPIKKQTPNYNSLWRYKARIDTQQN